MALFLLALPQDFNLKRIEKVIQGLKGIESTHHLHAWSLEGENHVMSMHVVVAEKMPQKNVISLRKQIRAFLIAEDLEHVSIKIEFGPNDCMLAA